MNTEQHNGEDPGRTDADKRYLCVFCMSGKEWSAAQQVMRSLDSARAFPVRQVKRFTRKGETERKEQILFPGYVFVEVSQEEIELRRSEIRDMIKLLHSDTGIFLQGHDLEFARWVFGMDGVIGFSKAMKEGERIRIVDGPLKELEGKIIKVDKRNMNALVELEFGRQIVKSWLGYDIITPTENE